MSLHIPRKRTILTWHRWLGIFSALFLISLSITGLALNHTEALKLDELTIRNSFILGRYGMASGSEISAYRINGSDIVAHLDGTLFHNEEPLVQAGAPIEIIKEGALTVVATAEALIYLTAAGQLIEKVNNGQLPYSSLSAVGINAHGKAVLVGDTGAWIADDEWLDFEAFEGGYSVIPISQVELKDEAKLKILEAFQGGGVSLYRVLLDLHAGRLFGWGGRTLMDLTAVAILILITSGIGGWLRKSRGPKTPPHAR
jgi:uncharacterized iron-regulated membrane protein